MFIKKLDYTYLDRVQREIKRILKDTDVKHTTRFAVGREVDNLMEYLQDKKS